MHTGKKLVTELFQAGLFADRSTMDYTGSRADRQKAHTKLFQAGSLADRLQWTTQVVMHAGKSS